MSGTFTEAYREAGYTIQNPRNQWSAQSDDGRVAVTIWSDEIDKSSEPWVIDNRDHPEFEDWGKRQGHNLRTRHIAHALENLSGRVDLVLCVAENPDASPRKIKVARAWPERVGVIASEDFDTSTGQFRMELRPREG